MFQRGLSINMDSCSGSSQISPSSSVVATTEKVNSDLFECPVCFEIPEGAIYQCRNGHSICDPCSRSLDLCPQCRLPLGGEEGEHKMRNRTMEAFIDGMEVGCRFEREGCRVRMSRKDLAAHLEWNCEFRPKFNLCKLVGLIPCEFESSSPDHIYRHFVEEHMPQNYCWVPNDEGVYETSLGRSLEYMRNSKDHGMTFGPIILSTTIGSSIPLKFLLVFYTNIGKGDYSVICLHLGHVNDHPLTRELSVKIVAIDKNFELSWRGKPTHYSKTEHVLLHPPFKISIPYLLEVLGDSDELDCAISFFHCN